MQVKRIMRFIGNRSVPEPDLFASNDPMIHYLGIDWGQRVPKSMAIEDLREFSKTCPNPMESDFPAETVVGKLAIPNQTKKVLEDAMIDAIAKKFNGGTYISPPMMWPEAVHVEGPQKEEESEREQFEVNLTEPLVGWRRWVWSQPAMSPAPGLRSWNATKVWKPCEAMTAYCQAGWPRGSKHTKTLAPFENCTCGIYAVDEMENLPGIGYDKDESNTITGTVYGWGRYVRGDAGWRCQFAYPKEFHLRSFQAHLIEPLKAFRVPITIDEPLKIYDPREDGYGNWAEEANRDMRTIEGADTTED